MIDYLGALKEVLKNNNNPFLHTQKYEHHTNSTKLTHS
jgi:hypothetical protein